MQKGPMTVELGPRLEAVLEVCRAQGCSYADVRWVRREQEEIRWRNGQLRGVSRSRSEGFGIRVLVGGSWGFASTPSGRSEDLERAAREAVAIARASRSAGGPPVQLAPQEPQRGFYATPVKKDPFAVPLEEKLALLADADRLMRATGGAVRVTEAMVGARRERKVLATTEGTLVEQELVSTGAGIQAAAARDGEVQFRSYPNAHRGHWEAAGWEAVERMRLREHAERVAREATQLLDAPPCPEDVTTVILDGRQVALQLHESCGHPLELDRVLGQEAAFAGTSFLQPEARGRYRYGSPEVNIVADATVPGGLGTFGWDDEGVPAQRIPLVERGIVTGFLTSRETATRLGERSNGAMRADGWNRIPLIRMTNINLEPGDWTLDEMIRDTPRGIYMEINRSWSIDDRRLNFQFGCEVAWEIRDGSRVRMLKNPTYTGMTPQFWASCDAVGDEDHWHMWGTPNCGKGQPGQVVSVGHGAAPARFHRVRVGAGVRARATV